MGSGRSIKTHIEVGQSTKLGPVLTRTTRSNVDHLLLKFQHFLTGEFFFDRVPPMEISENPQKGGPRLNGWSTVKTGPSFVLCPMLLLVKKLVL